MKLFPIPQLQTPLPETDDSDFWEQFELVEFKDKLRFPKDKEFEFMAGFAAIGYEETKLKAEGQLFTQRHLESLGVTPRPVTACPFDKSFPMYLVLGSLLKQLTRIPKHEELVSENLLIEVKEFSYVNLRVETAGYPSVQDPDDVRVRNFGVFLPILSSRKILKPWKRIIFISHRWLNPRGTPTSPPHPDDDDNTKLKQLQKVIRDDDYLMLDYISFPQNDYDGQGRAIRSLCWYIYHCSCFRVISSNPASFEEYLGRGWCQVELLSTFCPVLSRTEERSDGNFYLDFEDTNIDKFYVSAAPNRAVILGNGTELPLKLAMVKNPKHMSFSVPDDAKKIQGILNTVTAAFEQGRPRKETFSGDTQGRLTSSHAVTENITFEEASTAEVENLLRILST